MSLTFGLICAGVGFALAGGFAFIMRKREPTTLAIEIEQSIRTEPKRWNGGDYRFTRDDGLELWIGSGCSGMMIQRPRKVTFKAADKRLIWKAYQLTEMTLADLMASTA